jgi:aryl-alcohol dehydrogenase-like predicted oxidoreductase
MYSIINNKQKIEIMNQTTTLGHSTLSVKRIGLGCMGMSEFYGSFNEEESINTLHKAIDIGVNFFDTADMYGWGANERLLGKAFKGRWSEGNFSDQVCCDARTQW